MQKKKKKKKKKKNANFGVAPTDAKGMHEAKIVHVKKAYTTRHDIYL